MIKVTKALTLFLIKILGLVLLLSFERVIGLPFLFSLLVMIWLDNVSKKIYVEPALILIMSFLMAVMYQAAWLLTILIWILSLISIKIGASWVPAKNRRFLIVVMLQNLAWLWLLRIEANFSLLAQLVVSYLLVIFWLKIFKSSKTGRSAREN